MKKAITLLLTLAAFITAQAQTTVVTYRIEGGPDTFWVVDSNVRVFPGGERVVEEIWRPVVGKDSLKQYLGTLETLAVNAEAEIDIQKQNRKDVKEEIRRIKKELEKDGKNSRVVAQPVMIVDNPGNAPASLPPGEYIWDGNTLTPKPKVKKTSTSKKKKG